MRSRLNLALVVAAGVSALVLTVIRQSPEGVVSIELNTQEVRAAPGQTQAPRHDLSALKIFNMTLLRIKERYVDPARVDPRKMLYAALDSVQFNIPEVLVAPDPDKNQVAITVNGSTLCSLSGATTYACAWQPPRAGTYTLAARASDDLGNTGQATLTLRVS